MAEKQKIQMSLDYIGEGSFKIDLENIGSEINVDDLQIGFSIDLMPDLKKEYFFLSFGVGYQYANDIVLQCYYRFGFKVRNLSEYVQVGEDGVVHVSEIMPHVLSVVLGTMRGILVEKTSGTVLSKFPIPIMSVEELGNFLNIQE